MQLSNPGWHQIRDPCNRGISDGTDLHQKYPVMPTDVHIFGLCLMDFLFFPFTWQVQIMWKLRFAVYVKQLNSHYLELLSLGVHHHLCGGLFLFFSDAIYLLISYLSILQSTYSMSLSTTGFLPIYTSLIGEGRIVSFPYHPISHHPY